MRLPITFAILLACLAPASGATVPDDKKPPAGLDASILANLKWRSIGPALTSGRIADFAVVESDPDGAIIGYYVKPEVAASAKPPTIQLDVLD